LEPARSVPLREALSPSDRVRIPWRRADFNEDGALDLAVPNSKDGTVTILLGNGMGAFAPAPGSPFTAGSNPLSIAAGDFNGDGRSDVALLIEERTTRKVGIAILESRKNQFKILGAGKSFGNGGDDFNWMDVWSMRHSGKADQLYVGKKEAASAVIYWDGSKYKWQQEGD